MSKLGRGVVDEINRIIEANDEYYPPINKRRLMQELRNADIVAIIDEIYPSTAPKLPAFITAAPYVALVLFVIAAVVLGFVS